MAVIRSTAADKSKNGNGATTSFVVSINLTASGSKHKKPEEQDAMMPITWVKILVVDDEDPTNVLVSERVHADTFSTGSVGYKLHTRGAQFRRVDA